MLKSVNGRKDDMNVTFDEVESSTTATSLDDDTTIKPINTAKSPKKRPDSLNLSYSYNEITSDLTKMTPSSDHHHHHHHHLNSTTTPSTVGKNGNPNVIQNSCASTVDVNQSKSLSVDGNKSHHDGKKSTTSYDLWVNENVGGVKEKSENIGGGGSEGNNTTSSSNVTVAAREKKLDLPGRVSFSFRYVKKFLQARNNYILCVLCHCHCSPYPHRVVFCSMLEVKVDGGRTEKEGEKSSRMWHCKNVKRGGFVAESCSVAAAASFPLLLEFTHITPHIHSEKGKERYNISCKS